MYEAAGNALWLATGVFTQSRENINMGSLESFADKFFSKRVVFKATVTRQQGAKKQKTDRKRLVWPAVMICLVDSVKTAIAENPDAGLPLLPTAQFLLWSWYLSLYRAIKAAVACLLHSELAF